ncbi:MAG: hypothetical protein JWO59_2707 [Chloroflexi bacterium]|nr:hypothetical protein [Chloroflexota bacterium]
MSRCRTPRIAGSLLFCAAACWTGALPVARADSAVTLRYKFVPGEILTYRMTTVSKSLTTIAGQADTRQMSTTSYQSHYVVHSVDAAGNATMSVLFDPGHATDVKNGKATHRIVPPEQLSSPADACIQENDGTQYCVYRGGYGLNDIGQVAVVPVPVGGTWNSVIDNTWAVDNPTPVTLHNTLKTITSSAQGRVANVDTAQQLTGTSKYDAGGKHYAMTVRGSEFGTWAFGIDSGVFLSESVKQTIASTGTVTDKKGTHAISLQQESTTTMQLTSTKGDVVRPLGRGYTTKTLNPTGVSYAISYPSSWQTTQGKSGNYQIESPDKNGLIFGFSVQSTTGDVTNPAYVTQFLRTLGTPMGTITSTLRNIGGQQYGIVDAIVRFTRQPVEAQCEVRVRSDGHNVTVLIGIVSLGPPGLGTRPLNLAREYEQIQRSLDSVVLAA